MKLHLVRHARAAKRAQWAGPPLLRPLCDTGRAQAHALGKTLAASGIERIVSSPALRCRQTLAPLAHALGIPVEIDERLGEGSDEAKLFEAIASMRDRAIALCTHGETIGAVLERYRAEGLALEDEPRCEKGSYWILEGRGARPSTIRYAPPSPVASTDEGADTPVLRFGVLDLGSTSFHLLVADATADGDVRRVLRERVMLRLGATVAEGGRVPDDVCERAVETARVLGQSARNAHADLLIPVATAALRDASNGEDVARRIGEAVGVPTRILSGAEEARLTFAAFRRKLKIGSRLALGLDLGGGSLELITGDESEVRFETTLPLGAARLHAELVRSDPMTRDEKRAVRTRVRERLDEFREALVRWAPRPAIATGGTMRALARLLAAQAGRDLTEIHGTVIPAEEFRELARTLVRSTQAERLAMPGMRRQRADLVPTGALVLRTVLEELELPALTVSDWGLREGVILEALELS
jgi:exopolyphosphatase/guanosine-5'-triphosphate,3'-diphosphate pyrophosphatase